MHAILNKLLYEQENRRSAVLVTVIREEGSAPRGLGASMLVGEKGRLVGSIGGGAVERATLILFGDRLRREYRMMRTPEGFSVTLDAPERPEALWYSIRLETEDEESFICPNETGCDGELCRSERGGFRLTVYRADFETPAWFRHAVMYQVFPDRFAFSDDDTAARGIAYHEALGQILCAAGMMVFYYAANRFFLNKFTRKG